MNRKIAALCLAALSVLAAPAAPAAPDETDRVSDLKIDRSKDRLLIDMRIDATDLGRKSDRESWLTPVLTTEDGDSLALPTVMAGGRNRYYMAQRRHAPEPLYRGGVIDYSANVEYQPWMEGAELSLVRRETGCCNSDTLYSLTPLAVLALGMDMASTESALEILQPEFIYIPPTAEPVKNREISGRAFIDFPVNVTEIIPGYRGNAPELAKVRESIDSVSTDPDITVRSLSIHGYASPEGPLAVNTRLAKGRTEALKTYVDRLYNFPQGFITTQSTPEDWEGLCEWLSKSGLPEAAEVKAVAAGTLPPDQREAEIKRRWPALYARLLSEVYPALRHSDYRISYTIRAYTDPLEILRMVRVKPQNLSLNEFFLAAQTVEPGSDDYNYLFETAARMYPQSEVAAVNAANVAMTQGALDNAATYLSKAGDGPEAVYARGILAALRGDYAEARTQLSRAAKLKVAPAPAALSRLDELEKRRPAK